MLSPRHPRRYVQLLRELLALLLSSQTSKIGSDIVDRAGLQVAEVKEPLRGMFIGRRCSRRGKTTHKAQATAAARAVTAAIRPKSFEIGQPIEPQMLG